MNWRELAGNWVHRTAPRNGDYSYGDAPIFILRVTGDGLYFKNKYGCGACFIPNEWFDGAWALWPYALDTPDEYKKESVSMNVVKRSEDKGFVFFGVF